MWQTVYQTAWRIAPPLLRRYLRRRARQNPAYAEHWGERFGEPHPNPVRGALWIHAVSVGETRAAQPLIAALKRHFPDTPLLLTQMTPTGRATAQVLFPEAQCRYLPYDRRDWVQTFLREHQPRAGILMETEIWPNLMHACREAGVPLFLANARLSARSERGYLRVRGLTAPALATLSGCFAQTADDARRLQHIGAQAVQVCGNTKYDVSMPPDTDDKAAQLRALVGKRPIWLAASTREYHGNDEAEQILRAWQNYRGDALLLIVPRHPERFQAACDTAAALGLRVQRRSSNEAVRPDTQVWVGDSMGEMAAYCRVADSVFVGGSLVDSGCQNIIEPMAAQRAVLFGPSTYNFQAACAGALAAGAAVQIHSAAELIAQWTRWQAEPQQQRAVAARAAAFVAQHRGAAEKMAQAVAEVLSADSSGSKL